MSPHGPVLCSHTVTLEGGVTVAGFLVRSPGGRELGYIWCTGQRWRWRTMAGGAFGERATKKLAAEVLVDIANVERQPRLPQMVVDARPVPGTNIRHVPPRDVPPASRARFVVGASGEVQDTGSRRPAAREPEPQVDWKKHETDINAPALTDAIRDALRRQK